uniref:Uncharacterized protein n=1 Tax=Solanum lycopersicum TaxID=4081 RepID=A0A3Q7FNL2_SOLLC
MPNVFGDVQKDLVYAYGWPSRLVRPIWRVKRASKRAYVSFRRFSCAIAHHFLGYPDSDVKNAKFFVDIRQDLVYAYGWPSRLVQPIWRVKRAPKRAYASFRRFSCAIAHRFLGDPDSDVKNAKFFRGHSSEPCLCIQLPITACPTHLEGQTSPEASIRLISTIFVCYSTPFFGPCLCIRLAITACPTYLEAHCILGDPEFDVKNAKNFRGCPSRPCLCIRLAVTAFATHLEGQTSPEASIRLISTLKVPNFLMDVRQDLVYAYG